MPENEWRIYDNERRNPDAYTEGWVFVHERMPVDNTIPYEVLSTARCRFCAFPPRDDSTSWLVVKRYSEISTWGIEVMMWFDTPPPPNLRSDKAIMARAVLANTWDDTHHIATGVRICRYCQEEEGSQHKPDCMTFVAERVLAEEGEVRGH